MKEYTVTLTEDEIETIKSALTITEIALEEQIKSMGMRVGAEWSESIRDAQVKKDKGNELWKKLYRMMI